MCGSTGRESCRSQFDSLPLHEWESSRKGGEYDIRSVMHYGKFFFNFEKIPLSVVGVFDFKRLLISTYRSFGGFFDSSGSLRAALSVGAREPLNFKVNTLYILEFNSRNSFSNPRRY